MHAVLITVCVQVMVSFFQCFRDKAVEQEVANLTVSCTIEGCTWKGTHFNWKVTYFSVVKCQFYELSIYSLTNNY